MAEFIVGGFNWTFGCGAAIGSVTLAGALVVASGGTAGLAVAGMAGAMITGVMSNCF